MIDDQLRMILLMDADTDDDKREEMVKTCRVDCVMYYMYTQTNLCRRLRVVCQLTTSRVLVVTVTWSVQERL